MRLKRISTRQVTRARQLNQPHAFCVLLVGCRRAIRGGKAEVHGLLHTHPKPAIPGTETQIDRSHIADRRNVSLAIGKAVGLHDNIDELVEAFFTRLRRYGIFRYGYLLSARRTVVAIGAIRPTLHARRTRRGDAPST